MLGFLYLYPNYDTDLINLYYSVGEKNLNTIIRDALRALKNNNCLFYKSKKR